MSWLSALFCFVGCLGIQLSSDFYSLQYFLESGALNIYLFTDNFEMVVARLLISSCP